MNTMVGRKAVNSTWKVSGTWGFLRWKVQFNTDLFGSLVLRPRVKQRRLEALISLQRE